MYSFLLLILCENCLSRFFVKSGNNNASKKIIRTNFLYPNHTLNKKPEKITNHC